MSRQRLRASFLEINTMVCSNCAGTGLVKSTESTAINVLRSLQNEISRGPSCKSVDLYASSDVGLYIMNHKRNELFEIEKKYKVRVFFHSKNLDSIDNFEIVKAGVSKEAPANKTANNNKKANTESDNDNVEKPETKQPVKAVVGSDFTNSLLGSIWRKIID